ncbi:MAG: YolD-like family protein [Ruminococcaceae bacterium]|nr:YolD-like family protein [Oscillospiraceae bacterium]
MGKIRAKMPPCQRAKQFAPFDAVVGLRQALKEKEKIRVDRKELSNDTIEEINQILKNLKIGETITIIWYEVIEQNYTKTTGEITNIDVNSKSITIENCLIFFEDIYKIF